MHTTANQPERARALCKRATQILCNPANVHTNPTQVYLALLPKFAALEFRSPNGDREQGRTLFEQLLATYPRKFDLWNQLADLETSSFRDGTDDAGVVRDLFERGSKVKGLKPRQAKAWFRRWAKWEEDKGDAKSRERVSAKALEWARMAGKGGQGKKADDEEEESDGDE